MKSAEMFRSFDLFKHEKYDNDVNVKYIFAKNFMKEYDNCYKIISKFAVEMHKDKFVFIKRKK